MGLTKRYIELETKSDEDSVREKNEINQEFELLDRSIECFPWKYFSELKGEQVAPKVSIFIY